MRRNASELHSTISDKMIFKRLFAYIKSKKKAFIAALIMMFFAVGIQLLLPILFGRAAKILGMETIDFTTVLWIVALYAVLLAITYVIEYHQTMLLQKTGQQIIYQIREEVFTNIEQQSIGQINQNPIGKLVTRVTNDTNTLNEMFTNLIINLIRHGLTIIGVIIAMFLVNVELSFYVMLVVPFVVLFSFIFRNLSRVAYRDVRHHVANVNAFLAENLSGMKITQVFNQEKKKIDEFKARNTDLKQASLRQIFVFGVFRPSIYVLYTAALILVLWISGKNAILGGIITFEIIIIFKQYIERLFDPIQQLAEEFNVLQSAFASSERIFEILDVKPDITDAYDAIELETMKGEIEFKNVWFKYVDDEWVLKDVSFKINAGDTVAFVGATGSGKTTILALIVRNYEIQKGQILIDGIDIKRIKRSSLRRHIGQMLQDVFLFSGTIHSNIQMREESITDEAIQAACHYVNAHHFIESLPNGYLEEVRERGNNFSSGQRQLLSFARTIVHQPKVMILDEATANIDTETEVLIQDSLEKMMNIGTMIIVAHRLSTIQHANKIIVLQKGEIIEEGTHQELLKHKQHYYKLYQLQYSEEHKEVL